MKSNAHIVDLAINNPVRSVLKGFFLAFKHLAAGLLIYSLVSQNALADTITYQQLRQDPSDRPKTATTSSTVVQGNGQEPQSVQGQPPQVLDRAAAPVERKSVSHPEFIRLPDGRVVRYGLAVHYDENYVEPVTPAAFRESGPRRWWIAAPLVAGGILCAVLCRPGRDSEPQPTPTIIIPAKPVLSPTPGFLATPIPSIAPSQVPEPGTIVMVGTGLAALFAWRRRKTDRNRA